FDQARRAAERATELAPRSDLAWVALGRALEHQAYHGEGNAEPGLQEAVKAFTQGLVEQSSAAAPLLGRGRCQYRWAERAKAPRAHLDAALDDLTRVAGAGTEPGLAAEAHYWLGRLHAHRESFSLGAALDHFDKAVRAEGQAATAREWPGLAAAAAAGLLVQQARYKGEHRQYDQAPADCRQGRGPADRGAPRGPARRPHPVRPASRLGGAR